MTISQIAHQVFEGGPVLIRFRETVDKKLQYDTKDWTSRSKSGWTMLDIQTANAIHTVYAALNEEQRAMFDRVPLRRLVDFCWKHVRPCGEGKLV